MGFDFLRAAKVQGEELDEQSRKYYEFADQLNTYYADHKLPGMASPDVKYALSMQEKRLQEKNITVTHKFMKRESTSNSDIPFSSHRFDSNKHHAYYNMHKIQHEAEYRKNGKVIGKLKDKNSLLYQYSVYLNDEQNISENDTFCCPNCGAINKITTLMQEGCPYCNTRFTMSTIFPVITNYFYNCKKNKSARGTVRFFFISAAIFAVIMAFFVFQIQIKAGYDPALALITAIIGGVIGLLPGYMIATFIFFFYMIIKAIAAAPAVAETSGTKKKIEGFMQTGDPFFSYEYFTGTAQSLLRAVLLSDKPEELSFYEGSRLPVKADEILDSVYVGDMSLENCGEQNGFVYLSVGLYMYDTTLENEKIKIRPRKYSVDFRRRNTTKTDYGFSIHKVQCKQCGGSFDATIQKSCTFCGAPYAAVDDDWVINNVRKVKKTPYYLLMS